MPGPTQKIMEEEQKEEGERNKSRQGGREGTLEMSARKSHLDRSV